MRNKYSFLFLLHVSAANQMLCILLPDESG